MSSVFAVHVGCCFLTLVVLQNNSNGGCCDAFLAWYTLESLMMTKILTGSCLSQRRLPALSLNRACICCSLRRRHQRRTLGLFFSDVSCVRHSRCTLNSSWSLVAHTVISKIQSGSLSLSDFPVRTRPEIHRRCPAFELFLTQPRSKNNFQHKPQNPTTH